MLPKAQLVAVAAPRRVLSRKAADKPLPHHEHQKKKGGLEPPKWKSLRKTYNPQEISESAGVGSLRRRIRFLFAFKNSAPSGRDCQARHKETFIKENLLMESSGTGPRLIIVCGLPGSGKTTLAKAREGRGSAMEVRSKTSRARPYCNHRMGHLGKVRAGYLATRSPGPWRCR